ncbi:unnamed protein product, partial [Heterosigma akashiwo]
MSLHNRALGMKLAAVLVLTLVVVDGLIHQNHLPARRSMLQDRETVLKGTQLGDVASSDRPLDEERDALDRVDADAAVLSEVKLKRALTDI